MVLLDTSVWVEAFRKPSRLVLTKLVDLEDVATCLPVVQEVLQGFRDERAFRTARDAMLALPTVESPLRLEVFDLAIDLYRTARKSDLTIRSGADWVIAACAIRNNLTVYHVDRDFELLASVSGLRTHAISL